MRRILIGVGGAVGLLVLIGLIWFYVGLVRFETETSVWMVEADEHMANESQRLDKVEGVASGAVAGVNELRGKLSTLASRVSDLEGAFGRFQKAADEAKARAEQADRTALAEKKELQRVIADEKVSRDMAYQKAKEALEDATEARRSAEAQARRITDDLRKQINEKIQEVRIAEAKTEEQTKARTALETRIADLQREKDEAIRQYNSAKQAADKAQSEVAEVRARIRIIESQPQLQVTYLPSRSHGWRLFGR